MAFNNAMKMMKGPAKPKAKMSKAPDAEMGKEKPEPKGSIGGEEMGDSSPIHAHLKSMHEMTGNAHSHVEHHMDGHHTSHHVSEMGEMSGPHDHPDSASLGAHMGSMGGGGQHETPPGMGNHPFNSQQDMTGF